MEIMLSHFGIGMAYDALDGLDIHAQGNRLEAYRFIEQYHGLFGLRWLLRRLKICPNAYYNYRKHRKADY